jgi:hypothetical protein
MAYTTPATSVAGTVLTASYLNTYVRDNVSWLATDSPACRAYNNAAFTHNSSGNWLAVTLNSERFDNAAMHSTSVNTARFTVPTGGDGKYLMAGSLGWASNATGEREIGLGINGIATFAALQGGALANSSINANCSAMAVYQMAAADFYQMCAFQSSGGSLNVSTQANYSPEAYTFWFRT